MNGNGLPGPVTGDHCCTNRSIHPPSCSDTMSVPRAAYTLIGPALQQGRGIGETIVAQFTKEFYFLCRTGMCFPRYGLRLF